MSHRRGQRGTRGGRQSSESFGEAEASPPAKVARHDSSVANGASRSDTADVAEDETEEVVDENFQVNFFLCAFVVNFFHIVIHNKY